MLKLGKWVFLFVIGVILVIIVQFQAGHGQDQGLDLQALAMGRLESLEKLVGGVEMNTAFGPEEIATRSYLIGRVEEIKQALGASDYMRVTSGTTSMLSFVFMLKEREELSPWSAEKFLLGLALVEDAVALYFESQSIPTWVCAGLYLGDDGQQRVLGPQLSTHSECPLREVRVGYPPQGEVGSFRLQECSCLEAGQ